MVPGVYTLRCDKCSKCMGVVRSEDVALQLLLDILADSGKLTTLCPDCFVKENDNE